jgi:DNA ligase-1
MQLTKFQLAEDWDPERVEFPVIAQPKVDGVRAGNLFGRLSGRSLKPFGNLHAGLFFSQGAFLGFDGEMTAEKETHPNLCHLTTSALNTHEGTPWLLWMVFDYLRPETVMLPYHERYKLAEQRVNEIKEQRPNLGAHLQMMPSMNHVEDMETLECLIQDWGEAGYEGTIIRNPYGIHKNGRSSPTHRGLLRIKNFIEVDCQIHNVREGRTNLNEAKINANGHTERSTHQANMVPNGMVGTIVAELLEDAKHPFTGKVVHRRGELIEFSPGKMGHDERKKFMREPHLIQGRRMKGQIFPHGVKDKPRFPTFQSFRSLADTIEKD